MSFDIDDIVTLDDGKEFYLIDKNVLKDTTYFYAVEYTGDVNNIMDNEYCFFEVDGEYLIDVDNVEIISELVNLFNVKIKNILK